MKNISGPRQKIHLYHQPKTYKKEGKVDFYSLASNYKKDGKNLKKIIQRIGRLTSEEAANYRSFLKVINNDLDSNHLVDIKEVIFKEEKHYLDVLVLNALWEKLGFNRLYKSDLRNNQYLSTESTARILTINKLLSPCSKTRTIPWLASTLLSQIMGINPKYYTKTKIFEELININKTKSKVERHCTNFSKKHTKRNVDVYYFDGSTSWFEGTKCELAKYELEKTRGLYAHVIGLMLITDVEGFPIVWEIVEGNKKDVSEFKALAQRVHKEYNIKEITYCFDRGVASKSNFATSKQCLSKFISGIKDNQIKKVFNLESFEKTRTKILEYCSLNPKEQRGLLPLDGFYTANKKIFYRDLGVVDGHRYIASFNREIYNLEAETRNQNIQKALLKINEKNIELRTAKGDRNFQSTEKELIEILQRFKVSTVFDYTIIPIVIELKVQSFHVEIELKINKIKQLGQTDGLMLYITDHTECDQYGFFQVSAYDIVRHYCDKYVIENAFREMKQFLDLRPFYVWKKEQVKGHYDIGINAYFINNYIYRMLCTPNDDFVTFLEKIKKNHVISVKAIQTYAQERNLSLKHQTSAGAITEFVNRVHAHDPLDHDFLKEVDDYCPVVSIREFYSLLKENGKAIKLSTPRGLELYKIMEISPRLKQVLGKLNLLNTLSPKLHTSHGVYQ